MAKNKNSINGGLRSKLAFATLIFSGSAITILAVIALWRSPDETMTIFNIVLPVFATWIGTILAFYFGRENFESANQQVQQLVDRITPEERAKKLVTSIMRSLFNMAYFQILMGKAEEDIKLSELTIKFSTEISRLPIIDADKKPKYIVHESSIDKYIASGGKKDDTFEVFLDAQKKKGFVFGLNEGFVMVSEEATLDLAKQKMEKIPTCKDIFVTKDGTQDEPLTGWISNVRLTKYLEA